MVVALEVAEAITAVASTPVQDQEVMEAAVMAHLPQADPVPPRRLAHRATAQHIATTRTKGPYSR